MTLKSKTRKTTTEKELREWVSLGLTKLEIAEKLNTSKGTISTVFSALGIKQKSLTRKY